MYVPEEHGFDPALESLLPLHDLVAVSRLQGIVEPKTKRPAYERNMSGALADSEHFQGWEFQSEVEGVLMLTKGNRSRSVEPFKGGYIIKEYSPNMLDRFYDKENGVWNYSKRVLLRNPLRIESEWQPVQGMKDQNAIDFATAVYFLRQGKEGELTSVLPRVEVQGNTLVNKTLLNLEHFEESEHNSPTFSFKWKLINGSIKRVTDELTITSKESVQFEVTSGAPSVENGAFKINPSLLFCELMLTVSTGRYTSFSSVINLKNL